MASRREALVEAPAFRPGKSRPHQQMGFSPGAPNPL